LTAQMLRLALQRQLITTADIWGTDAALWRTLQQSEDPTLRYYLAFVTPDTQFRHDEANPTFSVTTKIRTLDPDVLYKGEVVRYSLLDPTYADYRRDYLARKQGPWPVRVVGFQQPLPKVSSG